MPDGLVPLPGEVAVSQKRGVSGKFPKTKKAQIAACLGMGMSIAQAALECDVSRNQISSLLRDDEFKELIQQIEDEAIQAMLSEVSTSVRRSIKELGPKAVEVLDASLNSEDSRVALQAAGLVLRSGALATVSEERTGWESAISNDSPKNESPASGD